MEKLYIIITLLLKGIISSHTQPVLNSGGSGVNEVWNFSGITATLPFLNTLKHLYLRGFFCALSFGILEGNNRPVSH